MYDPKWYRETYLRSAHWRAFRKRQLGRRPVCEECLRSPAVELHHRRYRNARGRTVLGREKAADVTAICRSCHDQIEDMKKRIRTGRPKPVSTIGIVSRTVRRWITGRP